MKTKYSPARKLFRAERAKAWSKLVKQIADAREASEKLFTVNRKAAQKEYHEALERIKKLAAQAGNKPTAGKSTAATKQKT